MNPIVKNFIADAAIGKRKVVNVGTDYQHVAVATAPVATLVGVAERLDIDAGDRVDVIVHGEAEVECGGAVADKAFVMPDADGNVVTATAGNFYIGKAMQDGVDGDIIRIVVMHGEMET